MSKSINMLRTRRRDNNVKPNRRLDRRSSRGMIYENEELRLRTININAEIERGQYDIKKLKRENELLKKEIWCLRDEYEKLDKLLKDKEMDFSSSSTTCSTSDSDSCSSCTEASDNEVETNQNLQNVQKTNLKNLRTEFDHLSVVAEETGTEISDRNSVNRTSAPNEHEQLVWSTTSNEENVIKADQSYPSYCSNTKAHTLPGLPTSATTHFFSPIQASKSYQYLQLEEVPTYGKESTDLIVKIDNTTPTLSTFSNGGNLEELLQDIETISQDILKITNSNETNDASGTCPKPYKSELNVVLMPNPMPLIGFEKYKEISKSFESVKMKSNEMLAAPSANDTTNDSPFFFGDLQDFDSRYDPECFDKLEKSAPSCDSKNNLLEVTSSEQVSSENEENLRFQTSTNQLDKKSPKLSMRRKVSIHFKGKKDKSNTNVKEKKSFLDIKFGSSRQKTPSLESKKSTTDAEPKTPTSSDSKTASSSEKKKTDDLKKTRKSVSLSPDRTTAVKQHHHGDEKRRHRKHKTQQKERTKSRRGTLTSVDRLNLPMNGNRERSYSACTERSNNYGQFYDDCPNSERERTNSMSSCETVKTTRKLSNISNIPLTGKVPWCACWGNGCV